MLKKKNANKLFPWAKSIMNLQPVVRSMPITEIGENRKLFGDTGQS